MLNRILYAIIAVTLLSAQGVRADSSLFTFVGPSSVTEELRMREGVLPPAYRSDLIVRTLKPWFEFKENLRESYGFDFALDYHSLYQNATHSAGDSSAAAGVFRAYGDWMIVDRHGKNTGGAVFKVENRHRYGSNVAPHDFGFDLGAVAITGASFGDDTWLLANLFWQQKMLDGHVAFAFGQVDVTDYVDVYSLVNPQTAFSNLVFLNNPTIALPDQGVGAACGVYFSDHVYCLAGLADANGDPTDPNLDVFSDFETFKHAEVGWTSMSDRIYLDNIHLTVWQVDARECEGIASDHGVVFSAAWFFNDQWAPFLRAGVSKGDAGLYDQSISVGIGHLWETRDLFGFGFNWDRPSDHSLRNQIIVESFYRLQFSENFAITGDVQFISRPALNPSASHNLLVGIRGRLMI